VKICVPCKKEMKCVKTGCICVWHGSHVYAADEYECFICGSKIRVCNTNPYFDPEAMTKAYKIPLDMTESGEE